MDETLDRHPRDDETRRSGEPLRHGTAVSRGESWAVGILWNTRVMERAFSQGRGPDPATRDISLAGAGGGDENQDPLLQGR